MTDKVGIELEVGDRVAYANGGRGETELNFGKIESLTSESCKIRSDHGRMQTRPRYSDDVISLKPFLVVHPELYA